MAKKMKLNFIGKDKTPTGEFHVLNANRIGRLYFPLFNMKGFMSAVTPELKGDIKTGQNTFLTEPQVTESILETKNSRNFWLKIDGKQAWSVTGISAEELALKAKSLRAGNCDVHAGPGYFSILRENKKFKLSARIDLFVPSTGDPFEISLIKITNHSDHPVRLEPTAAVPLYGRSADNLRDHRQVTTMLNRVRKEPNGVVLSPTMSFDERGHKPGSTDYTAHGFTEEGVALKSVMADLETFIGEGGSLEAPEMIYSNLPFEDKSILDGRQVIGALRFSETEVAPGGSFEFVVLLGIHSRDEEGYQTSLAKFDSVKKVHQAFEETKKYWKAQAERLLFFTPDSDFNNWLVWVSLQPVMRRVFGCSFLPDFGYGRGGRGWRDLWQDCLGILLTNPSDAREILLNNIQGVRIDGSNATIIGLKPGEFIADRNNIPRTWMDHGVWPLMTLDLYIQQTGDWKILLEKRGLFQDRFSHRCKKINPEWSPKKGTRLTNENGSEFKAEIIFHLLIQNLTQFYNRGEHGNIRLEDADWNDGLDMAGEKGESVPFTAAYSANLSTLASYCRLLSENGIGEIVLPVEAFTLIESPSELNDFNKLKSVLEDYFSKVEKGTLSGNTKPCQLPSLAKILEEKAGALREQIRQNEFINTGEHEYFNGYYNNHGGRVEGVIEGKEQMTLTGQVFPIMSGVATEAQCKKAFKAASDLLRDKEHGGFRLNTNFGRIMLELGRAFSFSYGDKENGSFFSHMIVMFGNALYRRGLVKEGYEVLTSIYKMWKNTEKSLFFPCMPEYFDGNGRARYCYITGSGAWTVMTMLLEIFGVRGSLGNLCFFPKLLAKQFGEDKKMGVQTLFQGKRLKVTYFNPEGLSFGNYRVSRIECNGKEISYQEKEGRAIVNREIVEASQEPLELLVTLSAKA